MEKVKIMIVDDSRVSRTMLANELNRTNFDVVAQAKDAAEAVRHGVDRGLVLLRQRAHIVVHLISGIAHNVYAAGLIGRGVGGDNIGCCRLRGGHGGLIGVPALTTLDVLVRLSFNK